VLLQARSGAEELAHPAGQVPHLVSEQALVEALPGQDAEIRLHTRADDEEVAAVESELVISESAPGNRVIEFEYER